MTLKPISNANIKRSWKPYKKHFGFSRNDVLKMNSNLNIIVRSIKREYKVYKKGFVE